VANAFSSDETRTIFLRATRELGWRYRITGTSHVLVVAPDGKMAISLSITQNAGGRRMSNYWARIKRWEREHGPDQR